jgi:excisionase family DNA binding protein
MYKFDLLMAGTDSWMTVKEASTYLGKSAHWLYQNRERLQIPCTPVGGTLRFEKSQLDDWLSTCSQGKLPKLVSNKPIVKVTL